MTRTGRWRFLCLLALAVLAVSPLSAADKASGQVRFVGDVHYWLYNYPGRANIAFGKLQNQHPSATSGAVSVYLFVSTQPLDSSVPNTLWFIATGAGPRTLAPGESIDDVDVTVPWNNYVPDGIWYVHVGAFEEGSCTDGSFCRVDVRTFGRVRVYQTSFYEYAGPPVAGDVAAAVEYFHTGMGHYFVTAQADEIAGLDAGVFAGWERTGQSFGVWTSGQGLADVCRFFTDRFAPKSSHFYTANATECAARTAEAVWQYEKIAFKVAFLPFRGVCPIGVPLYRLYNDGKTGAPNHRYTTSFALRESMIAAGFVPEDDNIVCVASGAAP
jgi:hypothetical protein